MTGLKDPQLNNTTLVLEAVVAAILFFGPLIDKEISITLYFVAPGYAIPHNTSFCKEEKTWRTFDEIWRLRM